METRSITTSLLELSVAYVFGSFLRSATPDDIDILIVYDPRACSPIVAYERHRDFVARLQQATGIAVHLTLLTTDEERGCGFINDVKAIRYELIDDPRLVK
jgi:predicted nucleotidyltransferase